MSHPQLQQIGKYQLTDLLGEGAMGVVYRAFDPVLSRYLAIKLMSPSVAADAELRNRFLREARAAGSLQHPNIVTIYDFGEVESHLFIAMEYVEGSDLSEIIERRDPVPLAAKLDIIVDVLNGLAYAHSRGVVHRDIKPGNIRVSAQGHAKVMDFGIAHLEASDLTKSGVLIGTPNYMAPEQVTGAEITPATDIFAVGAVWYEFLTCTKPFDGETLHTVLFKVVSEQPTPLLEQVRGLPAALEPVVARALAKDPRERFESALAMAKAVTAVRTALTGGEQATIVVRKTPLKTTVAAAAVRPQRRKIWTGFGGVAATGVAVALWLWSPWSPEEAPTDLPAPSAVQTGPARPPAETSPQPTRVAEARPSAPPPAPVSATGATGREDSVMRSARGAALGARRRAQEAGATTDLVPGDSALRMADALASRRLVAEAVSQLASAQSLFRDAERTARDRAVEAERRAANATPAAPPAPAPQQPAPAAPEPLDPRPEIEAVIARYARAIESRELAEVRRTYPGLTSTQQERWEQFFAAVTNLRARLSLTALDVSGATAEASISGFYEYQNTGTRQTERQRVQLQATLQREAGGWRLSAIR